jgi:hypothetical protein
MPRHDSPNYWPFLIDSAGSVGRAEQKPRVMHSSPTCEGRPRLRSYSRRPMTSTICSTAASGPEMTTLFVG